MRVAWFRPSPIAPVDARIAAALATELSRRHVVDAFDERTAHEFVWKHFRAPYDVCLYETASAPRYRFARAYLVHYPGALLAHDLADARDLIAASRIVVVNSVSVADLLAVDVPADRICAAPAFAPGVDAPVPANTPGPLRVSVLDARHRELVSRAVARAGAAGAAAVLVEPHDDVDRVIRESDVVVALQGPLFTGPTTGALLGMSAARPVIVSEAEATAEWPALDPQTWLPRGYGGNEPPIAVSIDPRDEEHSVMLAIRRLSSDGALRGRLGTAAKQWWQTHATPMHAAERWQHILEQAASAPMPVPAMTASLASDGTGFARQVLGEFGVSVDLFDS